MIINVYNQVIPYEHGIDDHTLISAKKSSKFWPQHMDSMDWIVQKPNQNCRI